MKGGVAGNLFVPVRTIRTNSGTIIGSFSKIDFVLSAQKAEHIKQLLEPVFRS